MLKLWGRINSINVQKVLWALEELNVPYERTDAGLQYGVVNETIGKYSTVYVCGPPVKGWPGFWKHFQYYG